MFSYIRTTDCLMVFLRGQLDDEVAGPCGRCSSCAGLAAPRLDPDVVAAARRFLRAGALVIEPRLQGVPVGERLEPGRALSVLDDGEWGSEVSARRAVGHFGDDLVAASAELLGSSGSHAPFEWVAWVPSVSAPESVADFARRLAALLGVPAIDAVHRARASGPQAAMQNSFQQKANVLGAFVVKGTVPAGPVLLVDDLVDSRWTFTAVGAELRRAGSGAVVPFALARTQ
jgi:ATP-dependent DNA helicase RecQ